MSAPEWTPQLGDRVVGRPYSPKYEDEYVTGLVRRRSPHLQPEYTPVGVYSGGVLRGVRILLTSTLRLLPDAPNNKVVQLEDAVARHTGPARHRHDDAWTEGPHAGLDPQGTQRAARPVAPLTHEHGRHALDRSAAGSGGAPPNGLFRRRSPEEWHALRCAWGDVLTVAGQLLVTALFWLLLALAVVGAGFGSLLIIIDLVWGA